MASLRNSFDVLVERRTGDIPRVALTLGDRLALVRQHGDFSLAYSSAVQRNLHYHGDAHGYIAYGSKMGSAFALGDPVAPPAMRADYIRRFVDDARNVCFVQIGRESAETLASLGFRVNRLGVDSRLDLPRHDFSGKRNETVRYSERWLLKHGYAIVETHRGAASARQIEVLSSSWRAERIVKRREMRFLNRPHAAALGQGMRRFVLIDPTQTLVAVLDFDPLHRDGALLGYTTSFKRKLAGVTPHAEIGMTKFAADRFRGEGLAVMTLGLSPLAEIGESGFDENRLLRGLFRRAYQSQLINRRIFNLQGQAAFKRRFHGVEEPTYVAFRKGTAFEMLGLLRLCKVI